VGEDWLDAWPSTTEVAGAEHWKMALTFGCLSVCVRLPLQITPKSSPHSLKGLEALSSGHLTANYRKGCMFSFFKFVK